MPCGYCTELILFLKIRKEFAKFTKFSTLKKTTYMVPELSLFWIQLILTDVIINFDETRLGYSVVTSDKLILTNCYSIEHFAGDRYEPLYCIVHDEGQLVLAGIISLTLLVDA